MFDRTNDETCFDNLWNGSRHHLVGWVRPERRGPLLNQARTGDVALVKGPRGRYVEVLVTDMENPKLHPGDFGLRIFSVQVQDRIEPDDELYERKVLGARDERGRLVPLGEVL